MSIQQSKAYLSVSVSDLDTVRSLCFQDFDRVILGYPFCPLKEENLLYNSSKLELAIGLLKEQRLQVCLASPAQPLTDELAGFLETVKMAVSLGIDGIEIHDMGVWQAVREAFPDLPIHLGVFANIYSRRSLDFYLEQGVNQIMPNYELTFSELEALLDTHQGLEITVHGKLPLGTATECLFQVVADEAQGDPCRQQCGEAHILHFKGWDAISAGTATFTGKDFCLIENISGMLAAGFRHFRIEAYLETANTINQWGSFYRKALNGMSDESWKELITVTENLCNGWFFGKSGRDYCHGRA